MTAFPRSKKEFNMIVAATQRRRENRRIAIALGSAALFLGLTAVNSFHASAHEEKETWATFHGDCANIRAEFNADTRVAKVVIPPACRYTNSNY
ncbi:MAG TPA: hypothetical protein VL625_11160 [Patescibacteria group bacterium]|nr:hypothetical protein [Patescibacteria group bacterium]